MGYDSGKSGISTYINESVQALVKDYHIRLLILKKDRATLPVKSNNRHFIEVANYWGKSILNMLWHLFIVPFTKNLKQYDFCFLPAANRRLFCKNPVPTIAVFHDLSQLNITAKYSALRQLYIKTIIPYFLKKVTKILTVSENTQRDLFKYYKIPPEKVAVNHNGFDHSKFKPLKTGVPKSYSVLKEKKDYFLYVSRLEHPGKNHIKLIDAYEKLSEAHKEKYNLVFAGQSWSNSEVIEARINQSPDKERIFMTGFISQENLRLLYMEAHLFIFPSLYEGFGFPLLKTMASGVPAICSRTSSLPEIGGDAILTFAPENPNEIKDCIEQVLNLPELYNDMKKKGLKQVEKFNWAHHVENIIKSYEQVKKS